MSSELNNPGGTGTAPARALQEKLQTARLAAMSCWPFAASALLRLVPRWSTIVPTLAVDKSWRLYLNPKFVDEQTPATLALLLVGHELQHALGDHANRLLQYRGDMLVVGDQQVSLANVAHDLAINCNLKAFIDSGAAYRKSVNRDPIPMDLPEKALYPSKFKDPNGKPYPDGQISEVYAELLKKLPKMSMPGKGGKDSQNGDPQDGQGQGDPTQPSAGKHAACGKCGSAAGDGNAPWEDPSDADARDPSTGVTDAERDMLSREVARAAQEQEINARGTVPAGVQMWAKATLTPPKVDWRKELRRAVKSGLNWIAGLMDPTYARRNKRSTGRIILPGYQKPTPRFVVLMDFSGSMGLADYDKMFSEIAGIIRASGYKKIPVLGCDAAVDELQMVSSVSEIRMVGGGGTDMGLGIRAAVEEHKMRFVIVCTDGATPYTDRIEGVRVVVCLTRPRCDSYPIPDWMHVVECYDR